MTNPQKTTFSINGRFGAEGLVGSSTEAAGNIFDLLVAIPAPATSQSKASLASGWFILSDHARLSN